MAYLCAIRGLAQLSLTCADHMQPADPLQEDDVRLSSQQVEVRPSLRNSNQPIHRLSATCRRQCRLRWTKRSVAGLIGA